MVWSWEGALARLQSSEPELASPLLRSCRPLAAERLADGGLQLVLGCWWPPDLRELQDGFTLQRLESALSAALEDPVRLELAAWPELERLGNQPEPAPNPPDLLAGLPIGARQEAQSCESALQRLFFAHAWRRSIKLTCQLQVLIYRLDFALPSAHVGAEILGWRPHGRTGSWDRVRELGSSGWRVLWFPGREVLGAVERCVDDLERELNGRVTRPGRG